MKGLLPDGNNDHNRVICPMPLCKACGEDVDEVMSVAVDGKKKKLCEECIEELEHAEQMAEDSEAAIQQMMGFKGRR